jgi:sulfane dehydrogenase subunit SoxC
VTPRDDLPPTATPVADAPAGDARGLSRRALIAGVAGVAAGTLLDALQPGLVAGQGTSSPTAAPPPVPASGAPVPRVPTDPSLVPGLPSGPLSARSPFETPALVPVGVTTGSSSTPLQALSGTITPSDLVFQRHHNGIALVDPDRYELLVHGLVERPTSFSLADLQRFPAVTRVHFLECAGNGRAAYRAPKPEMTPQDVDGLTSNCEWTGVPLATLLREVGVRRDAAWLLAEGGDAAKLARSVPVAEVLDDALVVYAQNGEPLRAPTATRCGCCCPATRAT